MKIFNWIGFMVVATGVAHIIFAVDSSVVNITTVPPDDKPTKSRETGRMSNIWERQIISPHPYSVHHRPQLTSTIQSSKYPDYSKTDFRVTVRPADSTYLSSATHVEQLERDSRTKSYGYGGGHKGYGRPAGGTYYYAQPLPYLPTQPHRSHGLGLLGSPVFLILILPLLLILFLVGMVAVVRISASSSSSGAAAAANQQQQQQQDSNNNNNNADNNNNNNAAVASVVSTSTSTFPFFIIINVTGRALEERYNFKWPKLFDSTFHHQKPAMADFSNETFLLP